MNTPSTQLEDLDRPVINMRRGQQRFFRLVDEIRMLAFVARRQFGKTTTFGRIALKKMMKRKHHTVVFGSAKLNLSREIVRKEAADIEAGISESMRRLNAGELRVADAIDGTIPDKLTHDDFASLFEAQRLEFRYYHSRTSYSRTKVVALRPDTVGETGDLMCDEVGHINNWRETWEAIEPIVASNPDYRLCISTTPPPDDSHYSFDQLAPPPGSVFTPNADGNMYESIMGVDVLRLDAWDAYLDNVPLYDLKTGRAMSPEEHRAKAPDKQAWDRNYGCQFVMGGSSAISLMALMDAQACGLRDGCIYAEDDLPDGWERLFTGGPVGIGGDPATTENLTSNPFGIVATEFVGGRYIARLVLSFKSSDPRKPKAILREMCRKLRPVALSLDASSEKYWCAEVQQEISEICPVLLMVSSNKTEYLGEEMLVKSYLGNLAVNAIEEDNCVSLPPHTVVKSDFRLVKRYKGGFDNALDTITGRHGDLFDGFKQSLHALLCGAGPVEATAVQVGDRSADPRGSQSPSGRMSMRPSHDENAGAKLAC